MMEINSFSFHVVFVDTVENEGAVKESIDRIQEVVKEQVAYLKDKLGIQIKYDSFGTDLQYNSEEDIDCDCEEAMQTLVKAEVERQLKEMFRGDV